MSENTKNDNAKVVVVANLKSPVIGFVLALFLGWLGVAWFYRGGIGGILLGFVKLIGGLVLIVAYFGSIFTLFFIARADEQTQLTIALLLCGYILWYVLDLIFVPLGIFFDNRKKLAIAKGIK